jgi:hypothetical protein
MESGAAPAKSNHQVRVVRVESVLPHPNADRLEIIPIPGTTYHYVGLLGQFKVGDLAYYIQPDSLLPERQEYSFLWEGEVSPIPTKRRRVRAKKLRGEWSEGLLMPMVQTPIGNWVLPRQSMEQSDVYPAIEGSDVADYFGITHYEPPEEPELGGSNEYAPGSRQNKIFPRSLKGWGYFLVRTLSFGLLDFNGRTGGGNELAPTNYRPVYDVESFKNFPNAFKPGEEVVVTEKIHGSNARFTFVPGTFGGHMFAGSRKLWKKPGKNIWREALKQLPWIEEWCKAHPDYTLYGEICPTQELKYGCTSNEIKFFVFDIRTPEGEWVNHEDTTISREVENIKWVPVLYTGPYDESKIRSLVDGKSTVSGADHLREGIVVRPAIERDSGIRGLGILQLKLVSNAFLSGDK